MQTSPPPPSPPPPSPLASRQQRASGRQAQPGGHRLSQRPLDAVRLKRPSRGSDQGVQRSLSAVADRKLHDFGPGGRSARARRHCAGCRGRLQAALKAVRGDQNLHKPDQTTGPACRGTATTWYGEVITDAVIAPAAGVFWVTRTFSVPLMTSAELIRSR